MRTGIFICARLGSTRLERKHLISVLGKEIERYLVDRINNFFKNEIDADNVLPLITTGNPLNNRDLEFQIPEIKLFYGNDDNIPLRHLEAALAFELDTIVSVDGDDILCSVEAMGLVKDAIAKGAKYVHTVGLPLGLNVMAYTRDFLEESLKKSGAKRLETGWPRIFDPEYTEEIKIESRDEPFLRFTLDYDDDFKFFEAILSSKEIDILNVSDEELVDFVLENKIYEHNRAIAEEYWENFNKKVKEERVEEKAEESTEAK